jgi:hypothetical protein
MHAGAERLILGMMTLRAQPTIAFAHLSSVW